MKNKISKIQQFALPHERGVKRIVLGGLAILTVCVSMYVYFVGRIVFDVVGRRTAEASIRDSQSQIAQLSTEYYAQVKSIDISQAPSVGLSLSQDTLYATRATNANQTVGMLPEL